MTVLELKAQLEAWQPSPEVEIQAPPLITEDGIPLESAWHRAQINLLIESLRHYWRDRQDYYVGGNMFLYYSLEQARRRYYRGPDFFVVKGVDGTRSRAAWIVWEEEGRYPDLIIELISPTSAEMDRVLKKQLYAEVFRTPEYFWYDPATHELQGWHLSNSHYEPLQPDARGFIWSCVLELHLGLWEGVYQGETGVWVRFYDAQGELVLLPEEELALRLEAERQRAERLAQKLRELGVEPE
jgi:Uma2 family endonuclease